MPSFPTGTVPVLRAEVEAETHSGQPRVRLELGGEHLRDGRRIKDLALWARSLVEQARHVSSQVGRGRVEASAAGSGDLPVRREHEPAGAHEVAAGEPRPHPFGPDEVGVAHPEWVEDVLSQVVAQVLTGDVLHHLPQRGEAVVAVHPLGARLDLLRQPVAVVLTEGLQLTCLHTGARDRVEQVGQPTPVADAAGVSQEVAQRCRLEFRSRRAQPEGRQVVVRGSIEVDPALLPQLQDRHRGEGLGERTGAEDGVRRDWCSGRHVADAVGVEPCRLAVADHCDRQTRCGPAVEDSHDGAFQSDLRGVHGLRVRAERMAPKGRWSVFALLGRLDAGSRRWWP